jgi:hypothetical protein
MNWRSPKVKSGKRRIGDLQRIRPEKGLNGVFQRIHPKNHILEICKG